MKKARPPVGLDPDPHLLRPVLLTRELPDQLMQLGDPRDPFSCSEPESRSEPSVDREDDTGHPRRLVAGEIDEGVRHIA